MRRRVRAAIWGTVLALHGSALAATAWVQWRLAHPGPEVLVTVAPPPPPPPRSAAPMQRAQPARRARAPSPVRRAAVARRVVAAAARRAAPQARRVAQRPIRVQQASCVVEHAALPASAGAPGGTAPAGAVPGAQVADREASPLPGCPQPSYPRSARRAGHTGLVLLRVHLDRHGNVLAVLLEQSSGHRALDHAARDAVLGWRFSPRVRAGVAVPCDVLQPVDFSLK